MDNAASTRSPQFVSEPEAALAKASRFVESVGLVLEELGGQGVTGFIELGAEHHTPWGIVHGGVYATAIESAASIGASMAVREQGMVAVGLTNTTHFLRSVTAGRVRVQARPLNQGRSQQLWQVNVTDAAGKLLAHGEVRLQNLAPGAS
jgi:1,4-dihydroxy-2-naphthoyl-CoA hydrolase